MALVIRSELVVKTEAIVLEPCVIRMVVVRGTRVLVCTTLVAVVKKVDDCAVLVDIGVVDVLLGVGEDDVGAGVIELCVEEDVKIGVDVGVVVLVLSVFDVVSVDDCMVDVGVDVGVVVVESAVVVVTSVVEVAVELANADDADAPVPIGTEFCRCKRLKSRADAKESTGSSAVTKRTRSFVWYILNRSRAVRS